MVSLTSSPWNGYCSAESLISGLCPSVMLAWYSWVSAITIVFPSLIASLISLSGSSVFSAISPGRQLLIQNCLELLHLDPGTLKSSFLQKFGHRQTTSLDSHWGHLRAETSNLESFFLSNTLLSFHGKRNVSGSKPFITGPQGLAFHRNRTWLQNTSSVSLFHDDWSSLFLNMSSCFGGEKAYVLCTFPELFSTVIMYLLVFIIMLESYRYPKGVQGKSVLHH